MEHGATSSTGDSSAKCERGSGEASWWRVTAQFNQLDGGVVGQVG